MITTPAPARLWASARYRRWLAADTSTQLGDAMTGFVIPLITLTATDDPAATGVVSACGIAARLLGSVPGGSVADVRDRVRLMGLGGLVNAALCAALVTLILTDALCLTTLLALNVVLGLAGGFFSPASNAALKDVVPASLMGRAQAANQGRDATVSLTGAPFGGVLLGLGAWVAAAAIGLTRVITTLAAWALGRRMAAHTLPDGTVPGGVAADGIAADGGAGTARRGGAGHAAPGGTDDAAGAGDEASGMGPTGYRQTLAWLWARADLRATILVSTLINLAWGTVTTTVIYSQQQLGTSPGAIGIISAAMGASMLLGALAAGRIIRVIPTGTLTVIGLVLITLGAAALPHLTAIGFVAPVMAAAVVGVPVLNAGVLGYVTVVTPKDRIGKVSAVIGIGAMLATPLGPLLAGSGLALLGRAPTLWVGAGMCLLAALLGLGSKALRSIPVESEWGRGR